jgi:hypothetical protein
MYILYSTVVWLGRPYVVEVTQTLKSPLSKGPPHEYLKKIKFGLFLQKHLIILKIKKKNFLHYEIIGAPPKLSKTSRIP